MRSSYKTSKHEIQIFGNAAAFAIECLWIQLYPLIDYIQIHIVEINVEQNNKPRWLCFVQYIDISHLAGNSQY